MRQLLLKGIRLIVDSKYREIILLNSGYYRRLSDEEFLKKKFKTMMGYPLDLENPKSFNEKLQWLKLYDRNPLYTVLVDKYAVKKYVEEIIGSKYIIPTLGVWNAANEIDFDSLPLQFVLKATHDSGGIVICRNKDKLDRAAAIKKLQRSLNRNYYEENREWPYKEVPKRIICEQYLEDENTNDLSDYKVHCFNGKPRFILVCRDRFKKSGMTEDFFTDKWVHIPVSRISHPNADFSIEKPAELDEILSISKQLTRNLPFARVDFYIIGGKVYFGEITFFPSSGFSPFVPAEYDYIFGEWLELPAKHFK